MLYSSVELCIWTPILVVYVQVLTHFSYTYVWLDDSMELSISRS